MSLPDVELLARCIYGEARGEPTRGQIAVANVVLNRIVDGARWNGEDLKGVILAPDQFSCFRGDDPNLQLLRARHMVGTSWDHCRCIATLALEDVFQDTSFGATHYYSDVLRVPPSWAAKMRHTVKIGHHLFFR